MIPNSILIVGADGAIGSHLKNKFENDGCEVFCTTRRTIQPADKHFYLDLSKAPHDDQILSSLSVDVAVICAGITSVDHCERDSATTQIVNVERPLQLMRWLLGRGVFVVFLSSNLVFDGREFFPTIQNDTSPTTEYGRQKVAVERELLQSGGEVSVIRLTKVIAPEMPLFMDWSRQLKEGHVVRPYSNKMIAPISMTYCVEAIGRIINRHLTGISHVSASRDISYADAAIYIARKLRVDEGLVQPVQIGLGESSVGMHTALDSSCLIKVGLDTPDPMDALDQLKLVT